MRELAVAIQNENEKVSIIETINSIKKAGFKNVLNKQEKSTDVWKNWIEQN